MNAAGNWKINNSNFFPLGIFSNSNKSKTVFVIWSKNILITYIFKKSGKSNSLADTYQITINEQIENIIITEFNTICLTESGRLYYFSSCKSLKLIDFLTDVRCLCSNHNGFSLIRADNHDQIYLETFKDFGDYDQIIKTHEKHEITFDETNIFDTGWKDKKFLILTVKIDDTNRKLMKTIIKRNDFTGHVHLFTIMNSLYGVYSKNRDELVEMNLLHTVATSIESIHYLNNTRSILLFTCCGSLEILYLLQENVHRSIFRLPSSIISLSFAENSFFYSTGEFITQKILVFSNDSQEIIVYTNEKPVLGIVAMTWVKSLRKLICLSENNIFYRIRLSMDFGKFKGANNCRGCYELNEQNIKTFQNNFADLGTLCSISTQIETQVEKEYTKQNLLNMIKRMHSNSYVGHIRLALESMPLSSGINFVKLTLGVAKAGNMLEANNWKLLLSSADRFKLIKIVNINSDKRTIQFVHQKKKENLLHLQSIQFRLMAVISHNDDYCVCIPLIVHSKNFLSPELIFSEKTVLRKANKINMQRQLLELAQKRALLQQTDIKEKEFQSLFKMPSLMDNKEIAECLELPNNLENLIIEFFGRTVNMKVHEVGCYLQLVSKCPLALYYLKILLVKKFSSKCVLNDGKKEIRFIARLKALKAEISNLHYNSNYGLQTLSEQLLKSYEKLRAQKNDLVALKKSK